MKNLIAFILLLAIAISFMLYQNGSYFIELAKGTGIGWIAYQDKTYGYSFKYPGYFGPVGKLVDGSEELITPKSFRYNKNINPKTSEGKYIYISFSYKALDPKKFPTFDVIEYAKKAAAPYGLNKNFVLRKKYKGIFKKYKGIFNTSEEWEDGRGITIRKDVYVIQVNERDSLWIEAQFKNMPDDYLMSRIISTPKFN